MHLLLGLRARLGLRLRGFRGRLPRAHAHHASAIMSRDHNC
jgi:hypothetical protein